MKIIIGSDHVGIEMKALFVDLLTQQGHEVVDIGPSTTESVHYPEFGFKVASEVSQQHFDRGILICGTGVGMSLVANKVDGVRADVCSEPYSAYMSRAHNNANILCVGARVIGLSMAEMILNEWISTDFEGGRHQVRLDMIQDLTS